MAIDSHIITSKEVWDALNDTINVPDFVPTGDENVFYDTVFEELIKGRMSADLFTMNKVKKFLKTIRGRIAISVPMEFIPIQKKFTKEVDTVLNALDLPKYDTDGTKSWRKKQQQEQQEQEQREQKEKEGEHRQRRFDERLLAVKTAAVKAAKEAAAVKTAAENAAAVKAAKEAAAVKTAAENAAAVKAAAVKAAKEAAAENAAAVKAAAVKAAAVKAAAENASPYGADGRQHHPLHQQRRKTANPSKWDSRKSEKYRNW